MTERVDFYVLGSADAAAALEVRLPADREGISAATCGCGAGRRGRRAGARRSAVDFQRPAPSYRTAVRRRQPPDAATPVHLSTALDAAPAADLLVNLSGRLPRGLERFARIAEIIDADVEWRRLGRERFKTYRDLQLPLATHQPGETGNP